MKATEGRYGRVFVLRLEEGDILPACIEEFANENKISVALVTLIGGIGSGEIVVGPRKSEEQPPDPMHIPVDGAHEVVGLGVLAPGLGGKPILHIHAALGRAGKTTTGCLRPGVGIWLVGEVIISEIIGANVERIIEEKSGFALLEPR